jgi:hypothetical protein
MRMDKRDILSAYSSLENARQNMEMKRFAKEVLLEENYEKFMKSYKFMFWFQLIGIIAGFIIPSAVIVIISQDLSYLAFGAAFGILWMCIWLIISQFIPQGKIYRKFAKWFRKKSSTLDELNVIFYEK